MLDNIVIYILMAFIGVAAVIYFICFIRICIRDRTEVKREPGRPAVLLPVCFLIYFLQALGFSEFVLGTIFYRKLKLVDDERLPQTLVMSTIVPGALAAITYLQNGAVGALTLLFCVIAELLGSLIGTHFVLNLKGEQIRKILGYMMIIAIVAFIIKTIVNPSGTLSALPAARLAVAMPIVFILGALNMIGVPMKPGALLTLLLLGLTPAAAMTILLTMGNIGPVVGGITVIKSGRFQKKIVLYAATVGLAAAIIGALLALNLNQTLYTVLLIIIMCYATYDLLKK